MKNCLLVFALLVLGCDKPRSIKLGDDSAECRKVLQQWGAKNVEIAWSYGIDLSLTEAEAQKRYETQRAENDFHDNSTFVWPELGTKKMVFLKSKYGKLDEITRIDTSKSRSGEWQRGFVEVTRHGEFLKANDAQAQENSTSHDRSQSLTE